MNERRPVNTSGTDDGHGATYSDADLAGITEMIRANVIQALRADHVTKHWHPGDGNEPNEIALDVDAPWFLVIRFS